MVKYNRRKGTVSTKGKGYDKTRNDYKIRRS